jgi:hypothetical protein
MTCFDFPLPGTDAKPKRMVKRLEKLHADSVNIRASLFCSVIGASRRGVLSLLSDGG